MAGKTFEVAELVGLAVARFDHGGVTTNAVPDLSVAGYHRVRADDAAITISAPLRPAGMPAGTILLIEVENASGGVVTITWNSSFKQNATAPANGTKRVYAFIWDGTASWLQFSDGAGDVS